MKISKAHFVFLVTFLSFLSTATTAQDCKPILAVGSAKMKILYIGVDNPVYISLSTIDRDSIIVSTDHGTIQEQGLGYIWRGTEAVETKIYIRYLEGKDSLTFGIAHFKVKHVPDPIPYIAGVTFTDSIVYRTDVLAAGKIEASLVNFEFDVEFVVRSFQLTAIKNGNVFVYTATDNKFTEQMLGLLADPEVKVVYFEKIHAEREGGQKRKLSNVRLELE